MKKSLILLLVLGVIFSLGSFHVSPYEGGLGTDYSIQGLSCNTTMLTSSWFNQTVIPAFETVVVNLTTNKDCALYANENQGSACCPGDDTRGYRVCTGSWGDNECHESRFALYCHQYETEFECDVAHRRASANSVKPRVNPFCDLPSSSWTGDDGEFYSNSTGCFCHWVDGACSVRLTETTYKTASAVAPSVIDKHLECIWHPGNVENLCETQRVTRVTYTVSGNASGEDKGWCQNAVVDYPCDVAVVVPFFSGVNLLITSFIMILLYYFLHIRKFYKSRNV